MALTYNAYKHRTSVGSNYLVVASITPGSSDYPTAGYALDQTFAGALPDGLVKLVLFAGTDNAAKTTSYSFQYNYTTGKLQAFWSNGTGAALSEVSANTDLSALTILLVVVGK